MQSDISALVVNNKCVFLKYTDAIADLHPVLELPSKAVHVPQN